MFNNVSFTQILVYLEFPGSVKATYFPQNCVIHVSPICFYKLFAFQFSHPIPLLAGIDGQKICQVT